MYRTGSVKEEVMDGRRDEKVKEGMRKGKEVFSPSSPPPFPSLPLVLRFPSRQKKQKSVKVRSHVTSNHVHHPPHLLYFPLHPMLPPPSFQYIHPISSLTPKLSLLPFPHMCSSKSSHSSFPTTFTTFHSPSQNPLSLSLHFLICVLPPTPSPASTLLPSTPKSHHAHSPNPSENLHTRSLF